MALLFFLCFALKGSSEHLMIYSFAHMNVITIISKLEVNPLLGDMARHNSRAERNQQQQICLFEALPHFDRQFQWKHNRCVCVRVFFASCVSVADTLSFLFSVLWII